MRFLGCLLVTLFLTTLTVVESNFLNNPVVDWVFDLPNEQTLERGNAVTFASNSNTILATTAQGALVFLDPSCQASRQFVPPAIPGVMTSCESGVTVMDNEEYVLYAVIDTPLLPVEPESRLFAVNMADASLRWEITLRGQVAGTPVMGADRIYVSHNEGGVGRLSVIVLTPEGPELAATLPETTNHGSFAPVAVRQIQDRNDSFDLVVLAEANEDGFSEMGGLWILQRSDDFDDLEGRGADAYVMEKASTYPRAAISPPTLSSNMEAYLGVQSSTVMGWQNERDLSRYLSGRSDDLFPWWVSDRTDNAIDDRSPILSAPVLSADESLVFVAAAGTEVVCLTTTGRQVWRDLTASPVVARPVLLELRNQPARAYFIESSNGAVRSYRADNGNLNWRLPGSGAVQADFSVSANGNRLYYGDVNGRIVSLAVATFATAAPSMSVSESPSIMPSSAPVATAFPSAVPSRVPTPWLSLAPSGLTMPPSGQPTDAPTDMPSRLPTSDESDSPVDETVEEEAEKEEEDEDTPTVPGLPPAIRNDIPRVQDTEEESSFPLSEQAVIALGAVGVGLILLAFGAFCLCMRRRTSKSIVSHDVKPLEHDPDAARRLQEEIDAYELECMEAEKQELAELGAMGPTTPTKKKSMRSHPKKSPKSGASPKTPLTLASIEESSLSEVDDTTLPDEEPDQHEIGFEISLSERILVSSSALGERNDEEPPDTLELGTPSPSVAKNLMASFENAGGSTIETNPNQARKTPDDSADVGKAGAPPSDKNGETRILGLLLRDARNEKADKSNVNNLAMPEEPSTLVKKSGVGATPVKETQATGRDEPGTPAATQTNDKVDDSYTSGTTTENTLETSVEEDEEGSTSSYDEPGPIPKSPAKPVIEEYNAPSPGLSELLSVDESLYIDEKSAFSPQDKKSAIVSPLIGPPSVRSGNRDYPDDESTRLSVPSLNHKSPTAPAPAPAASQASAPSPVPPPATPRIMHPPSGVVDPQNLPPGPLAGVLLPGLTHTAKAVNPEEESKHDEAGSQTSVTNSTTSRNALEAPRDGIHSRANEDVRPAFKGQSVRPKAGFLSRRGANEQKVEHPPSLHPTRISPSARLSSKARQSGAGKTEKITGGSKEDTWNNFLTELSKAEQAFFNPTTKAPLSPKILKTSSRNLHAPASPAPPPPPLHSPPDSPPPPPPPPIAPGDSDEGYHDEGYHTDDDSAMAMSLF